MREKPWFQACLQCGAEKRAFAPARSDFEVHCEDFQRRKKSRQRRHVGMPPYRLPDSQKNSVSKKSFRHAVRILKLSKKFQNPV